MNGGLVGPSVVGEHAAPGVVEIPDHTIELRVSKFAWLLPYVVPVENRAQNSAADYGDYSLRPVRGIALSCLK